MKNNNEIIIGEKIRQMRKERRITIKELAEGICSLGKMSNIENGKASPTSEELKGFAQKLRVSVEELGSLPFTPIISSFESNKEWIRKAESIEELFRLGFIENGKKELEEFVIQTANNPDVLILSRFLFAWYHKVTHDQKSSIRILEEIINLQDLENWQKLIQIRAKYMLSSKYLKIGRIRAAGDLLIEAREQVLGNKNVFGSEIWKLRFNLSILLIVQGDYDLARLYIEILSKEKHLEGQAAFMSAVLNYLNNDIPRASELMYKAKGLFRDLGNESMLLKSIIAGQFVQLNLSTSQGMKTITQEIINTALRLISRVEASNVNFSVYCLNILLYIAIENDFKEEITLIKRNLLVTLDNANPHLRSQAFLYITRAAKQEGENEKKILEYIELGLKSIKNKHSFLYGSLVYEKAKIVEKQMNSLFEESAKYFSEAADFRGLIKMNLIYLMPEIII